jgi:hypothetical protein
MTMRMIRSGRLGQRIGLAVLLFTLVCTAATQCFAADNLECPEIGPGRVPDLIGDASGGGLTTTENFIDLANEINNAIGRLEIVSPGISWANVQDVLIAVYCRVVAPDAGLSSAEKWGRLRQFTGVLEREIAADRSSSGGGLMIVRVPLAPDVYRELQSQAAVSHLTAAQLMTAILGRAAGR